MKFKNDDEEIGADIVRRALEEPLRQIVANSGEEGAIVVGKIRDSKDNNYGYNAQTDKFEDLVKAGVIDPTKVTRTALQNAASIAALMLTTEALVSDVPEEKKAPAVATTTAAIRECNFHKLLASKFLALAENAGLFLLSLRSNPLCGSPLHFN